MRLNSGLLILLIAMILSSCHNRTMKKESEEALSAEEYLVMGQEVVSKSFAALAGQLSSAMKEGGVRQAVGYCHLRANPIMDSLSAEFNAAISRVTLKARNPENLAQGIDSTVLADYSQALAEGKNIEAFVMVGDEGEYYYYAPIRIISPLCLKCHGTPGENLEEEDLAFILSKYPSDMAINYSEGELRGMWKIVFQHE